MKPTVGKNDSEGGRGNRSIARYRGDMTIADPTLRKGERQRNVMEGDPSYKGAARVDAGKARSFSKPMRKG